MMYDHSARTLPLSLSVLFSVFPSLRSSHPQHVKSCVYCTQLLMEEGGDSDSDIEEEIVEEDNTEATPSGAFGCVRVCVCVIRV